MVPSASVEPDPSKFAVRSETEKVKLATGGAAIAGVTRSAARKSRKEVRNIIDLVFIWSFSGGLCRVARMPREDTFEHAVSGFFAMARHGFITDILRAF